MYDITYDSYIVCIGCKAPTNTGVCLHCQPQLPFSSAWVVAPRQDQMKQLLHDYKFSRVYAAHKVFAVLLDRVLPILPAQTIIVPIPTIARHIRMRGYDHTALIARRFARQRRLAYQTPLRRKTNTVQVGADKNQRQHQAKEAFMCRQKLSDDIPYLIIDDIITTGATVNAAAQCLKQAGARTIMVAAIAR